MLILIYFLCCYRKLVFFVSAPSETRRRVVLENRELSVRRKKDSDSEMDGIMNQNRILIEKLKVPTSRTGE
jgi:hypothetical protein